MNKKGFTLIELIGVIVLLSLVTAIATLSLSNYLKQGREKSFEILINSFEDATLDVITSCLANPDSSEICNRFELNDSIAGGTYITLGNLLDYNFIEDIKNPWKTSERCSRDSFVIAFRNDKNNLSFDYQTCLICGNHKSEGCNQYESSE